MKTFQQIFAVALIVAGVVAGLVVAGWSLNGDVGHGVTLAVAVVVAVAGGVALAAGAALTARR